MKAILEFNLPEEHLEHLMAMKCWNLAGALEDIRNYFRNKLKYETLTDEQSKLCDMIYKEFYEIIKTREIEDIIT